MLNEGKNILSFDSNISDENIALRSKAVISDTSEILNKIKSGLATKEATGRLVNLPQGPVMLNLGCGLDVRDGFINIDLFSDNPNVIKMDVRKLEFADNSVDFILASDILEHFSHRETDAILAEWARVLKPNAQIIIRCPSLKLQVKAYTEKKWDADVASFMIFGGQSNPGDYHCIAFDEASIKKHLIKAGFQVIDFEEIDTPQDQGFINLNMIVKATKSSVNHLIDSHQKNFYDENIIEKGQVTSNNINSVEGKYLNIVWEGTQFVYHSLALINREHCKNIIDANIANVTIIPYEPDAFSFDIDSNYKKLYDNDIRYKQDVSNEISKLPYVWIRHQWPPKAEPPKGAKWIIMQPWEYSKLGKKIIDIFNQADEIWTPSNFSRQAFINSGIDSDKVQIIPNGINPDLFKPIGLHYKFKTQKTFKFLYVGGTTYRKGFDILLQAYIRAFKREDDVCLVVKDIGVDTFYKGQTSEELIAQVTGNPNAPEIEYIKDSLTDIEIAALYRSCDMFVSPYRGEGFSLPTLEAMASGLSVIVTRNGATDDFTTEENAWYINSESKIINNSDNDNIPANACLLEPNIDELIQTLEYVVKVPKINYSQGLIGSYLARKHWTWKRATMKILSRLDFIYGTEMAVSAAETLKDEYDELIQVGEAEMKFIQNDYETAEQLFVFAAESNKLDDKMLVHAFNRLAQIAISKEQYLDAYKYSEAAKTIAPNNPDSAWISGVILAAEAKYIEALETVTPIVDKWDEMKYISTAGIDLEKHLLLLADILFQMNDIEKAVQIYEAALKINNYSPEACYGLAMCYKEAELFEDAKKMFEWAIKYKPDYELAKQELSLLP